MNKFQRMLLKEWQLAAMDELRFRMDRQSTPLWRIFRRYQLRKWERKAREEARFYAFMLTEGYY